MVFGNKKTEDPGHKTSHPSTKLVYIYPTSSIIMDKKDFTEKVFENPELDRLIKEIWASGAVTQEDVRKVCSGEPVLTHRQLDEVRRVKNLQAKALLQNNVA